MFKRAFTSPEFMRIVLVPVVLGLFAGVAGALIVGSYLFSLPMPDVSLLQLGRPTSSNGVTLPAVDVALRLRRIDMPLYPRKASGAELPDRARIASEAIGYAAVITSDGWLATSAVNVPIVVAVGGKLLEPKVQVTDPRTGIVFLKVEASALPVSGFQETDILPVGTPLFAQGGAGLFTPTAFAGTVPTDRRAQAPSLQSSDRFSRAFRLDRPLGAHAAGGAVLTSGGDLAGIVVNGKDGTELFVPMHLIRPILAQVFRGETPRRAQLGVQYITLEETAFSTGGFGELKGGRLTASRALGLPAVRPGSAAANAGLQEGDILLRADNADLSSGRDLAEVIAEAEPGAKIRFDVLKDGAERSVEVTLDGEKR